MELRLDGLLTYPIDLLDLVLKDCSSYKTVLVREWTSLSLDVIYQCWGCSLIQTHSIESHNRYNQYFIMICCYFLGERNPLFVFILTLLSLDLVGTDTVLNEIIDLIHSILHFSAVVWHLELLKSKLLIFPPVLLLFINFVFFSTHDWLGVLGFWGWV